MRTNQAIRINGEDALVERIFQDYHAGQDAIVGMAILRWPDGHQTQHTLRELSDADELYTLPYSKTQAECPQWFSLSWKEKVALAHKYFAPALAIASAFGPLDQANDGSPAELGCAFANATLVKQTWCDCPTCERQAYYSTERGAHGWVCAKCFGITQTG